MFPKRVGVPKKMIASASGSCSTRATGICADTAPRFLLRRALLGDVVGNKLARNLENACLHIRHFFRTLGYRFGQSIDVPITCCRK